MIFDEGKRKLLLREYRTLSATDRKALRLLSVIYFPVDVDSFQAIARTAGFREMADASSDAIKKRFTRWKKAKLVASDKKTWGDAWTPVPLIREPLAREAVREDEYGLFDRAFLTHAEQFPRSFPYRRGTGDVFYGSQTGWFRDMRTAFYTGDTALMHTAVTAVNVASDYTTDSFIFKGFKNPQPEIIFLCNPIDERLILGLPEEIGVEILLRATAFFTP
ncbi:hypothetical protein LJC31_08630, partial [Synergistaceae bacterium OttesenSCG-928-I11]|nr:hypothetical protein [Synergistaceae bacterium OttesenSCG-928-I11]